MNRFYQMLLLLSLTGIVAKSQEIVQNEFHSPPFWVEEAYTTVFAIAEET